MMKTELKLAENPSDFRKYGICCKFGFIRTICAEKGKSYANMVKGENAYLVCFHRPLVAYTEANPVQKHNFVEKAY